MLIPGASSAQHYLPVNIVRFLINNTMDINTKFKDNLITKSTDLINFSSSSYFFWIYY